MIDAPVPLSLTVKQRDCLAIIQTSIGRHGVAPSYDDIVIAMGMKSKSGAHRLVTALERKGRIAREPGIARSITVIAPLKKTEVKTAASRKDLAERLRRAADRLDPQEIPA